MRRNPSTGDNDAGHNADDENARKRRMTLRRRDSTGRAETFRRRKRRAAWAEKERDEQDADLFEVEEEEEEPAVIPPSSAPPAKDKDEESSSSSAVVSSEFSDYDDNDDDDDEVMIPPPSAPRFESRAIPLDRVELAVRINMDLVSQLRDLNEHLLRNPIYANHHGHNAKAMDIAGQNLARISDLLKAVDDWVPITVPGDQPRPIPPQLPEADGSEMRFTNVAASLGIAWNMVPTAEKMAVYERAAQLHLQHYGVRPSKVLMWTSEGYKPTAYYNKDSYERTMKRALEEYKGQK